MEHVDAWPRYYDKYNGTGNEGSMEAAWCKAFARSKETDVMLSALSASIISLRLVNVVPKNIHDWIDNEDGGGNIRLDTANQNVGRQELLDGLRCRFEARMWTKVTQGEATGGQEKGTPSLEQAKKSQSWLVMKGERQQANCLEPIVLHSVWNAARLHAGPTLRQCKKCGEGVETLRHRY